jgi:hypothetical protein
MARKQTLIHLHGTGRLENASLLNKGEIAVRHAETTVDTELAVKTTVGEQDVLVYIPSLDKVQGLTNAVDTAAKGYATAAQDAAEDYTDAREAVLQGQIDALVSGDTSVGKQIADALVTAKGYADAAQSAAEGTAKGYADDAQAAAIASGKTYTDNAVSGATTALQAEIDKKVAQSDYDTKVAELTKAISDEVTKRDTDDKALTQAIADEKAAREAAITGVNSTITTLESTLTQAIGEAKEAAIASGKTYTDTEVGKVNDALTAHTANTTVHVTADERTLWTEAAEGFNTFMDGEGLDATLDTLKEIQAWMTDSDNDVADLVKDIAAEAKTREDADKALGERIDAIVSGDTSVAKQIEAALVTAKGYADAAQTAAEGTAKNYTDTEIGKVETRANTYTDNAVSGATTALQAKIDAKVAQADYDAKMQALDAEDLRLAGLISGNTTAISNEVKNREAAISGVTTAYEAADTQIRTDFAAADTQIRTDFAAADTQIRTDFAAADTALSNRIKAIEEAKPIYNVTVDNTATNKITATKTDNAVALNFDNMVIDCGEY